jgi:hypothetical protein
MMQRKPFVERNFIHTTTVEDGYVCKTVATDYHYYCPDCDSELQHWFSEPRDSFLCDQCGFKYESILFFDDLPERPNAQTDL